VGDLSFFLFPIFFSALTLCLGLDSVQLRFAFLVIAEERRVPPCSAELFSLPGLTWCQIDVFHESNTPKKKNHRQSGRKERKKENKEINRSCARKLTLKRKKLNTAQRRCAAGNC
jgi:hypothetical protein